MSSIDVRTLSTFLFCNIPDFNLNVSIKLPSAVDVKDNLASVSVILNLWAPVAFAFDEPVALSNRDVSSVEVTKVSATVNPIR